jgi:hypothetical protein
MVFHSLQAEPSLRKSDLLIGWDSVAFDMSWRKSTLQLHIAKYTSDTQPCGVTDSRQRGAVCLRFALSMTVVLPYAR